MRILVLLMFLASLTLSMGAHRVVDPGDECFAYYHDRSKMSACFAEQERERRAEFVESASPACKEIAVKLQECKGLKGHCAFWSDDDGRAFQTKERRAERCVVRIPACQSAGVSVEGYLLCERKVMQGQLDEMQEQLDEMQESASGVTSTTERRKLGLNWGFKYGALTAPLYLNRAIKKALQELRESQCQQAEDGDV